jgi:hypothetical protein
MGDRDPFVLLGTSCHQPRRCLGGHDANFTKVDAGLDRRIVPEVAVSGRSSEMAKAESRWRASYTPGEWMELAGPTSLVALDPATSDLDAAVTLPGFGRLQTPDLHDRAVQNPPGNRSALSRDRTGTLPSARRVSKRSLARRPSAFNLERATTTIDSRTWPIEPQVSALSMSPWPDRR